MSIKNRLIIIATLLVFLIVVSVSAQQIATFKNNLQSSHSQTRYLSYIIADEFRQSSMDLTRLCRTYVATGDQKYWDAYWQIVKWRNGDAPRPAGVDARLYPGQHKKQADIMKELPRFST